MCLAGITVRLLTSDPQIQYDIHKREGYAGNIAKHFLIGQFVEYRTGGHWSVGRVQN